MRLLAALVFPIAVAASSPAAADARKLVRWACDADPPRVVVTLEWVELERSTAEPLPNAFDPDELVVIEGEYATGSLTMTRTCTLDGVDYVTQVEGVAGNYLINGRCGAWSTASVRITRGGDALFDEQLEFHCHDFDGTVVTRIEVAAGAATAEVTRVPFEEFDSL